MFCARIDLTPQNPRGSQERGSGSNSTSKVTGNGAQSQARCDTVGRQSSASASEPGDKSEDVGKALWNNQAVAGGDSEALAELHRDL